MTLDEAYDKFIHLDALLTDSTMIHDFQSLILRDLWQAVRDDRQERDRAVAASMKKIYSLEGH